MNYRQKKNLQIQAETEDFNKIDWIICFCVSIKCSTEKQRKIYSERWKANQVESKYDRLGYFVSLKKNEIILLIFRLCCDSFEYWFCIYDVCIMLFVKIYNLESSNQTITKTKHKYFPLENDQSHCVKKIRSQ